jgi:hypothetical protein
MGRPTEDAEHHFALARNAAANAVLTSPADSDLVVTGHALANIAIGLTHLSVGLRATYMKLEEIEQQMRLLKR